MKVFVSWSGELSKNIAKQLKKWIPCIIQSVEIFYSPDDIEKGENWDSKISNQLSECNYGIICLTSENTNAPWVHFEAGALAKSLESRVSALMINIKTSDIQGPLKRYQATKFDREDFYQLIQDINKATDNPLPKEVLSTSFEAIWDKINSSISDIIDIYNTENKKEKKVAVLKDELKKDSDPIEEILQLIRKQNVLLTSPEKIIPQSYIKKILTEIYEIYNSDDGNLIQELPEELLFDLIRITKYTIVNHSSISDQVQRLMRLIEVYSTRLKSKRVFEMYDDLKMDFSNYVYSKKYDIDTENVL